RAAAPSATAPPAPRPRRRGRARARWHRSRVRGSRSTPARVPTRRHRRRCHSDGRVSAPAAVIRDTSRYVPLVTTTVARSWPLVTLLAFQRCSVTEDVAGTPSKVGTSIVEPATTRTPLADQPIDP